MTNQTTCTSQAVADLTTDQRNQGNVQATFRLVASDFGYDDYDVCGCEIHRAKVSHRIKINDIFNVYGPGSTKRGATWLGCIEKSVQSFLRECAEEAQAEIVQQGDVHKFAFGKWMHLFGPGSKETQCRIVIDLEQSKLISAQEWTGLKFEDVLSERLQDLSESVIGANDAHDDPSDWGLEVGDKLPDWAEQESTQGNVPQGHVHENYIKVAADSIAGLRKVDVFRVIAAVLKDNSDGVTRESLAAWIKSERADLTQEVIAVMVELTPQEELLTGDDAGEVTPGATSCEIREVMMQDIVGDYDVPEQVPEWSWVESNASFAHVQNGTSGVWEFVMNLSVVEMKDIPEKLRPVFSKAVADNIAYLIFHQGT